METDTALVIVLSARDTQGLSLDSWPSGSHDNTHAKMDEPQLAYFYWYLQGMQVDWPEVSILSNLQFHVSLALAGNSPPLFRTEHKNMQ